MMALVYDFAPDQFDLQSPVLRRKLGRDTAIYLAEFQARLQQEAEELGRPPQFSINIDYKLALVRKVSEGDIVLTKGDTGTTAKVVVVPKDSGQTHPYRRKEVVEQVNGRLSGRVQISGYDIQCVVNSFGIRSRSDYYYQGSVPTSPVQYSREFVDLIVEQFRNNGGFFESARARVKTNKPSK
jgi:EC042_2821-lke REase